MRRQKVLLLTIHLTLVALFLVGCAPEDTPSPPTDTPVPSTPVAIETLVPSTPVAIETPVPSTPVPPIPTCIHNMRFVADVTIPDDTAILPGVDFVKTWRIGNNGNCPWPDGTNWIFADGNQMGGPSAVPVPVTNPGETVDMSVDLIAPSTPGTYTGYWTLRLPEGRTLSQRFFVRIVVPAPAPTDTPVTPTDSPSDPDLVLQSFTITKAEWTILGGFNATVEVVVKNVGNGPASVFDVGIVGVNREDKYVRFGPALLVELAPGQEVTLTSETGLSWHGHFDVTCADENYDATLCAMRDENTLWLMAIADYCEGDQVPDHCAVEEIDEANNTRGPVVIEKPQTPTPPPTETPITPTPIPTKTPVTSTPTPTETPEPPTPVVILMDRLPEMVYKNADILADLPVEIREEITNSDWDRGEEIRNLDPDLIVIHWSALYFPGVDPPQDFYRRLDLFMDDHMQHTRAKFLFYTRPPADEAAMKGELEGRYPYLNGRLHVLANAIDPSWDQRLEDKVRSILELN